MKTRVVQTIIGLALVASIHQAAAQGTALTYQGQLTADGASANGSYDMQFYLRDALTLGNPVGTTNVVVPVTVSNGLFTVILDFGDAPFDGTPRWLEIGVRTNGSASAYSVLVPRQALTATPYAIRAANLSGLSVQANGTSPNLIGGFSGNSVQPGTVGATIGGGGASGPGSTNAVGSDFSVLGGGAGNVAGTPSATYATVGGGYQNKALSKYSTVAGGVQNTITSGGDATIGGGNNNQNNGGFATIAGGDQNHVAYGANWADIGGGQSNTVKASGWYGAIGGGQQNTIAGDHGFIGGGASNLVGNFDVVGGGQANTVGSDFSGIFSGQGNTIGEPGPLWSFIGGGQTNGIGPGADHSVIGGGSGNQIQTGADHSSIDGGSNNQILTFASGASIGGGFHNEIDTANSVIAGGQQNLIAGDYSVIGGGFGNRIEAGSDETIGGGYENVANGNYATVVGGAQNVASGQGSFVGGGGFYGLSISGNSASGNASTVVGGYANSASGAFSTVAGGYNNVASGLGSFAAGRLAQAIHSGTFVWSDGNNLSSAIGSTSSNQFIIHAAGGVGIGTSSPVAPLDVVASQGYVRLLSLNQDYGSVLELRNNTGGANWLGEINFADPVGGVPGQIAYDTGDVMHFRTGGVNDRMRLSTSGLWVNGTFVSSSDRNAKENLRPVNVRQVLDLVNSIPVSRWNYKQDTASEHIGPMAQDFYAAFKVGPDDKHITTVDEGGVALAAVQGLNQKLETELKRTDAENAELKQELSELKTRVEQLVRHADK